MSCCFNQTKVPRITPEDEEMDKDYFIKVQNAVLTRNDKVFKFASFNIPGLLMLEDRPNDDTLFGFPICQYPVENPKVDGNRYFYGSENGNSCIIPKPFEGLPAKTNYDWVPPTPLEQEDAILSVKGAEGRVIRTYCIGFGPRHHVIAPNQFYEPAWVAFDNALALARKHGIKLIIPVINNHFGGNSLGAGYFGDYISMCQFRKLSASQFYNSPILRRDMKDILTFMLNRTNTVNGIKYKDDSTVLAWQLGNELGGWDGPVNMEEYLDWVFDISTFIKTLAPKTLIADGTLGGTNATARLVPKLLEHPALDIFSNHYYNGEDDLSRINTDSKLVTKYGKAFIIGEFGFEEKANIKIYKKVISNALVSGALIWSLRYHSRDGGFYTHHEDGGYYSYHVPGFPENINDGFGSSELNMTKFVRTVGLQLKNKSSSTPFPTPRRCSPVAGFIQSPNALRWFGSAWAASYQVERKEQNTEGTCMVIATSAKDNVPSGRAIYNDITAQPGKKYEYSIKPVSVDGIVNHDDCLCIKV